MTKVSVITPVYNGERFIAEAIDSVLTQELQDWELIIVDDGSTDATPQILAQYDDPRIKVIRQENGGEASARNTALDATTGEFVAFLDADDLYLPDGLAAMVGFLESHPQFGAVYSDGIICDQDKKPLLRLSEIRPGVIEGNILEHLVVGNIVTVPVCVAVRRSAIEEQSQRFDSALKYGVDWDFWIQLARHFQFGSLSRLTCQYRIHGSNMTSSVHLRQRKHDMVAGRLKVMNADWFSQLSLNTRGEFFSKLLIDLLGNDPEQQCVIMRAQPYQNLAPDVQAELLRRMAGSHLSRRQDTDFAVQCLRRSLDLQPKSHKGRVLYRLANRSPSLAATALSGWRIMHNAQSGVRSLGKRKPKPVPAALLPTTD
jgi:glycosyltransferase involved in cell wall biosynthesis